MELATQPRWDLAKKKSVKYVPEGNMRTEGVLQQKWTALHVRNVDI